MQQEIYRKLFHLLSFVFPFGYFFLTQELMVQILAIITIFTLTLDVSRKYSYSAAMFAKKLLGPVMRQHEINVTRLSGSSYMALGFLFSAMFFAKPIVIISWLVLLIADSLAALAGRKYGKPIAPFAKSMIGSAVFFLATLMITISATYFLQIPQNYLIFITISAIVTTLEFIGQVMKIDDNLLIPVSFCSSYTILNSLI